MLVIVLDNLIKKLVEFGVSVVRSGINTNARVLIGNTRENAHFEGHTLSAFLVLILFPNVFGEAHFAL